MTQAILLFDVDKFREQCPAFSDPIKYPDAMLQAFWDAATYYMSDVANCGSLKGEARRFGLNYMTAHLLYISELIAEGTVPYVLQAATIDKVQVTSAPVPLRNQWNWWMQISPYGQSLWALLQVKSVGGLYVGGSPVVSGFRGYGISGFAYKNR